MAFIYNNDWGPLSNLLKLVGLGALDTVWLSPSNIIASLTVAIVWTYVGYYMIIISAGIEKIPRPTSAAKLDGAAWQQFFYILPCL